MRKVVSIAAFLDLDSTLCKIEGLDFLAEKKGIGKKVSEMTKKAMDGSVSYQTVMLKKIEMIRPSKSDFFLLGEKYLNSLTSKAEEFIKILKQKGADIFIVTGNFEIPALMLAKKLGIKERNVFANKAFFNKKGEYLSVDLDNPLLTDKGKREIVKFALKRKNYDFSFFVGDGSTDLATKGAVDIFIGFGGVVTREKVKAEADFFAMSFKEVLVFLEKVLSKAKK